LIYLETTVLIVYTLTKLLEKERYNQVASLIEQINADKIQAITSFYALHEVFLFAMHNMPDDPDAGRKLGKEALVEILQAKVKLLPLLTRQERILNARLFSALKDSSDVSHAISAHLAGCQVLVSFDSHFADLPTGLEWKKPAQVL
jgi:predicted nucleic acid-binding protein